MNEIFKSIEIVHEDISIFINFTDSLMDDFYNFWDKIHKEETDEFIINNIHIRFTNLPGSIAYKAVRCIRLTITNYDEINFISMYNSKQEKASINDLILLNNINSKLTSESKRYTTIEIGNKTIILNETEFDCNITIHYN